MALLLRPVRGRALQGIYLRQMNGPQGSSVRLRGLGAIYMDTSLRTTQLVRTQIPVEVRAAARALENQRPSDGAVLARKGAVAFYASRPAAFFPRVGSLAALAAEARSARASHLYFSWYEGMLRPEFWYLLDTTAVVPGLTRIHATVRHPSVLYRIGPEFGRDPDWLADSTQLGVHIARAETRALTESQAWDAHVLLGHHARREGRDAEALDHYLAATRGAPENSAVWVYAGDMQLALGGLDAARACYERAMQIEPRSLGARLGIGWTQYRAGAWKPAAATWRPTIALVEDEVTLRAMRDAFSRTGAAAAVAEVDAALAGRPSGATRH